MDPRAFDGLTRKLASSASRRTAVLAAAAGMFASALALLPFRADAQVTTAAEQICRETHDVCRRDGQCCSQRCRQGRCACRRPGGNCVFDGFLVDRACCSRRCKQNGTCA